MTTETKTRKVIDYTASAVDLRNDPLLSTKLYQLSIAQERVEEHQKALEATDAYKVLKTYQEASDKITAEIKQMIDTLGSFQDMGAGFYAVKQRRESIIYKPELVRQYAPSKVASFVLIESVDSKALDALLKAGQITPEQARQCGEVKESFAYIVKV